jgi:hypothetical protein
MAKKRFSCGAAGVDEPRNGVRLTPSRPAGAGMLAAARQVGRMSSELTGWAKARPAGHLAG